MMEHHVSVYLKAGVLAHVQSTNGDGWPRDVVETDAAGVVIPLVRIDMVLEPTAEEVANAVLDHPQPRSAAVLFRKELEVVGGRIRYRPGEGQGGTIGDRIPDVAPV